VRDAKFFIVAIDVTRARFPADEELLIFMEPWNF
jgi:hypothetical protein